MHCSSEICCSYLDIGEEEDWETAERDDSEPEDEEELAEGAGKPKRRGEKAVCARGRAAACFRLLARCLAQ